MRIFSTYVIGIFLFLLINPGCHSNDKNYNVVVLFTDDQRWNTIQALGNTEISTPNMDRLVQMGVSFSRAHVIGSFHGAVCAPSRAMLLTGKPYMNIPRDYIDQGRVPPGTRFDFVTFPEVLRSNGYQTFFTGKWHNHTSKISEGFEEGGNLFIGGMHWPKEGGHRNPMLWDYDPTGTYERENRKQANQFSSTMYTDAAIDFLKNRDHQNPFCLYVAYTSPHDPREAPEEFLELYDTSAIMIPPNFLPEHPFDNGHLRTRDENLAPFPRTTSRIKKEIAGYYGMISEVDAQIGRVLDALEAEGELDRTIIVFAGDNGLAVGQHGLLGKQSVYDHSVRVPLIISAPGITGNRKATTLCSIHDIFPTITHLLDLPKPEGVEGITLVPALRNEKTQIREALHLSHANQMRAIRTSEDMKYIQYFVNGQAHEQLFDLSNDPWEMKNLASQPDLQDSKNSLSSRLMTFLSDQNDDFFRLHIHMFSDEIGAPVTINMNSSYTRPDIRFTLDGKSPTTESTRFDEPFEVEKTTNIQAAMFLEDKLIGSIQSAVAFVSPVIGDITFDTSPSSKYTGFGAHTLANGPNGDHQLKTGHWIGYEGNDFASTVKLKAPTHLTEVGIRYLNQPGNWIFPPRSIKILSSADGLNYNELINKILPDGSNGSQKGPVDLIFDVDAQSISHLKVFVENIGVCPDWHTGKGSPAWLFLDEIFVN